MKLYTRKAIEQQDQRQRTAFVNSIWGFKSVSLIGTQSAEGLTNLAIFSQVVHLGASPALVGIIVRPPEAERHTYENMKASGWFTINHISADIVEQAHQTSARYLREESEFNKTGLTAIYSTNVNAPYVAECRLRIGCRYDGEHVITQNNTVLVIGRVEEVWVDETAVDTDGFVDLERIGTLTCSGLDSYHSTQRIARFSYAKPNQPLIKI